MWLWSPRSSACEKPRSLKGWMIYLWWGLKCLHPFILFYDFSIMVDHSQSSKLLLHILLRILSFTPIRTRWMRMHRLLDTLQNRQEFEVSSRGHRAWRCECRRENGWSWGWSPDCIASCKTCSALLFKAVITELHVRHVLGIRNDFFFPKVVLNYLNIGSS